MNRAQFLSQLRHSLSGIPEAEKKEILYDYEVIVRLILQPLFPAFITPEGLSIPFLIFSRIGFGALGLLSVIGMWKLSQLFFRMTARYVQFNIRIIKKQEVQA
jgi:uncharacterized membrane protein